MARRSIAFRLDKNNGFEWIGEYDISADELLNGEKRTENPKAKNFCLRYWMMEAVQKKIRRSENWELKRKH